MSRGAVWHPVFLSPADACSITASMLQETKRKRKRLTTTRDQKEKKETGFGQMASATVSSALSPAVFIPIYFEPPPFALNCMEDEFVTIEAGEVQDTLEGQKVREGREAITTASCGNAASATASSQQQLWQPSPLLRIVVPERKSEVYGLSASSLMTTPLEQLNGRSERSQTTKAWFSAPWQDFNGFQPCGIAFRRARRTNCALSVRGVCSGWRSVTQK